MTLDKYYNASDFDELLNALNYFDDIQFIFTAPNIDKGNEKILRKIMSFTSKNKKNSLYIKSLGQRNYYSLINISNCVMGNSSSGITEVPLFNKHTINIGSRQEGSIMQKSILNCPSNSKSIVRMINYILKNKFVNNKSKNISKFNPSTIIVSEIKKLLKINTYVKSFYDL